MGTRLATLTFLLLVVFSNAALAQGGSSASQSIVIEVKPITKLEVSGNPGSLVINDAVAGSSLTAVSDNNTSYSMLTNLENMKIVASINNPMPQGTQLKLKLESLSASSAGSVDISSALTPVNVVTGIGKGSETNQRITYTFAANAEVGQIDSESRIITLTLTE